MSLFLHGFDSMEKRFREEPVCRQLPILAGLGHISGSGAPRSGGFVPRLALSGTACSFAHSGSELPHLTVSVPGLCQNSGLCQDPTPLSAPTCFQGRGTRCSLADCGGHNVPFCTFPVRTPQPSYTTSPSLSGSGTQASDTRSQGGSGHTHGHQVLLIPEQEGLDYRVWFSGSGLTRAVFVGSWFGVWHWGAGAVAQTGGAGQGKVRAEFISGLTDGPERRDPWQGR